MADKEIKKTTPNKKETQEIRQKSLGIL